MATDLGRTKAAAAGKHDAYVAGQLARAEGRIRALDLTAGLLGFVAVTLAYAVVMALCDRGFDLSPTARRAAFVTYLLGAAVYLAVAVVRPLRRRVNPYYAARQMEQTLPGAKNSVVNWVDLHGENLPPAILGAVGRHAARDLARTDLDKAISGRRTGWVGGLTALGVFAFLILLLAWGSGPFFYRLARAFNPFTSAGPAPTRTRLTLLRPENGDTTVTIGRAVPIAVRAEGQVPGPRDPDALKLHYRHQPGAPWVEQLLRKEPGGEWSTTVDAIKVQNGFWYKVTGGDAETPEYRVQVRTAPLLTHFEASYHYRPYVARADDIRRDRKLEALRGTAVTLRVRTNRTIKTARLDFEGHEGGKTIAAELVPDDPEAFVLRLVLDESGQYRLRFTSADGEPFTETTFSPLVAIPDQPPRAELTKPGRDVELPANGVLRLEGKVTDDIGVKSVRLRLEIVGGAPLRNRPYRSEDKMRLAGGGYLLALEYKDFVDLAEVRGGDGKPFALRPGMEVEYWLEARDACDYPVPGGNVGASKHYRVKIIDPQQEAQHQQQQKEARRDQQRHETKQDEKLKQENQQREQARKEQQQRQKEEAQRREEERKQQTGKRGEADKPKPGEGKDDEKDNAGAKGATGDRQPKPGEGHSDKSQDQKPGKGESSRAQREKDRQALDKAERLRQQSDKLEQEKGKEPKKGESGTDSKRENRPGEPNKGQPGTDGKPEKRPGAPTTGRDPKPEDKPKPDGPPAETTRPKDTATKPPAGSEPKKPTESGSPTPSGKKDPPKAKPSGDPMSGGKKEPPKDKKPDDKRSTGADRPPVQPKEATPQDVKEMAKDLQCKDGRCKQAGESLRKIANVARDPKARAAARKALEEDRRRREEEKRTGGTKPGEPRPPEGDPKDGKGKPTKKGPRDPKGGAPNQGLDGKPPTGGATPPSPPEKDPPRPSTPAAHRASMMQLDRLVDKVRKAGPKALEKLGMSEKERQELLQALRDMKRRQEEAAEKENVAPPRRGGPLKSMGGRTVRPGDKRSNDLEGNVRGRPPLGYRNAYEQFQKKLRESEKK